MKNNGIKILNLLTWASLILSSPAKAFELNFNSSSWEKYGDVGVVNPSKINLSTNGLLYDDFDLGANNGDFNFSKNPAGMVGFGGLEDFLGVEVSKLDVGGFAYEGSAIKQTFNANAGDTLKFTWNFRTNETALATDPWRGSFLDYTFFSVNGKITKLADINNATTVSPTIFHKETGTQIYEYTFNKAGSYTISIGLLDIDDFAVTSALTVNNINLEKVKAVPETITILGTFVVLGFGIIFQKEFAKNNK